MVMPFGDTWFSVFGDHMVNIFNNKKRLVNSLVNLFLFLKVNKIKGPVAQLVRAVDS